jgi:hypothetical protein
MKNKIIGIFICILFLGILLPTTVAETQTDNQIQPTPYPYPQSIVFGHISQFIILANNIIIGHADQLIYYKNGILSQHGGIIINHQIVLQMINPYHKLTVGSDLLILGHYIVLI